MLTYFRGRYYIKTHLNIQNSRHWLADIISLTQEVLIYYGTEDGEFRMSQWTKLRTTFWKLKQLIQTIAARGGNRSYCRC